MPSLNGQQFGGMQMPSMGMQASQTASMANPPTTMTGSVSQPGSASAVTNAVKQTTGVSDFQAANRSFAKGGFGNTMAGIGHSIMGGINAASTAAMAVPGLGEGVKAADIGLNLAVKGAEVFKGIDAAKTVDSAPTLYHGSGQLMKPGTVIKPGNEGTAFATSHRDTAAGFANMNANHTVENQVGNSQPAWKQQSMFNPVYEVKPLKNGATTFGTPQNPEYATSPHGFEVSKIHSWTSPGEKLTAAPSAIAKAARVKAMGSGID